MVAVSAGELAIKNVRPIWIVCKVQQIKNIWMLVYQGLRLLLFSLNNKKASKTVDLQLRKLLDPGAGADVSGCGRDFHEPWLTESPN